MAERNLEDAALIDTEPRRYDALLIVSFGGPEGPEDVVPFLENVLRGIPVKRETIADIAARYEAFGGVSPINAHTRTFISALQRELDHHGPALPIYWGNRNWHPLLEDTFAQMAHDGIESAVAYVTSTFSSYSGCRKYREDLYAAAAKVQNAPSVDKLRVPFNHPGFIAAVADRVREARDTLPAKRRAEAQTLFTAHSLPVPMAERARYEAQLTESARLVAEQLGLDPWRLVYQSNNASYGVPWLVPDIADALVETKSQGYEDVVVVPIGFVCDHMEVVLDLDVDAANKAEEIGINMVRAGTVGAHPQYVRMVRELIVERMSESPERLALGTLGPSHDFCPSDCCLSGRPGPVKPALCGADAAPPTSGG
jgi:ferrochelatase